MNNFINSNLIKAKFYICPECGNVNICTKNVQISCCGHNLNESVPQKANDESCLKAEAIEDEWFISSSHPMEKDNYISFVSFITGDKIQFIKQYPEWDMQLRIQRREHGVLLWYSKQNGLMFQYL